MQCGRCPFYKSGVDSNRCEITGDEYFRMIYDCNFVNDDGSVNNANIDKAFGYSEEIEITNTDLDF